MNIRTSPAHFLCLAVLCALLSCPLWNCAAAGEGLLPAMLLRDGVLVPDEAIKPGAEPATGLQKPFPAIILRPDNPPTPAKVELGRFLFFDPILSGDNQVSCAHCHHPDLGFADALPRSRGKGARGVGPERQGGVELTRGSPSLWNALYNHRQFWDGRAADLEEQARGPITDAGEMDEKPERLVDELRQIAAYRRSFAAAFTTGEENAVTFENVLKAIASFERTLVSFRSRYDRFAAGDAAALGAAEKRGLKLFLSTKTRCGECHALPTFARRDFKVIGVPDPTGGPPDAPKAGAEPGRGGGPRGAFKVPSLRNVALTAPYMHNGVFKTLGEVLDFYAGGGGRGKGLDVPLQDDKIRKFQLSAAEKADITAFLGALADVSALPVVPEEVPSGLPVVSRLARAVAPGAEAAPAERREGAGSIVEVKPGESIQDAVDRAGAGGRVRVHPGVYHETVLVIEHGVTIEGVVDGDRRPLLDGSLGPESSPSLDSKLRLADAVVALGNRFTLSGIEARDYAGNGVVVHAAREVVLRDVTAKNPGLYGLYPVECDGVLIEGCAVSGARDAGIYVGQSRNIIVRRNEAFRNVAGIEIENSVSALVEENHVHDNTGGILVFLLPFNPSKEAEGTKVARNRVVNNNTPNFADPQATVASVLKGTGVLVLATDRTEVTDNEIGGNSSYGIAVSSLRTLYPPEARLDVDPLPDRNWIHDNRLQGNGREPDERLAKRGLPGRDLLWDGTGHANAWSEKDATRSPEELPGQ